MISKYQTLNMYYQKNMQRFHKKRFFLYRLGTFFFIEVISEQAARISIDDINSAELPHRFGFSCHTAAVYVLMPLQSIELCTYPNRAAPSPMIVLLPHAQVVVIRCIFLFCVVKMSIQRKSRFRHCVKKRDRRI